MRDRETDVLAGILDALPSCVAVLDSEGRITSANAAWLGFSPAPTGPAPGHPVGANYLELCVGAAGSGSASTGQVATGLRAVLDATQQSFSLDYPGGPDGTAPWLRLTVVAVQGAGGRGAVVTQVNIGKEVQALAQRDAATHLLDSIVENIPTAVQLKSVKDDFRMLMWNKAAEAIYGLPREETIGRNVHDLWPAADADRMHAADLELIANRTLQNFPERVAQTRLRGDILVHMRKVALFDPHGRATHVLVIADDISERKQAELDLQRNQRRLQHLIDGLGSSMFVGLLTPDGIVVEVNRSPLVATGLQAKDVVGRHFADNYWWSHAPDLQRKLYEAVAQAAQGKSSQFPVRARGIGNDIIEVDFTLQPLRDEHGEVIFLIPSGIVVTERVRAEAALRASEADLRRQQTELRVLFDLMPAMIVFKDTDGRLVRVNRQVAAAAGIRVEDIEGRPETEVFPQDADKFRAADLEVMRSGIPKLGIVETIRDHDGPERWIQTDKVPYRDENGKVIGIVVMSQDITERKRDQDALRDLNADLESRVSERTAELNLARDEAEQANRAKSSFLAAMSHEIRTPMNGVLGMLEVLQETRLEGHQVEMIDLIRASADSLLGIIDDILDFSKIEAGKLGLEARPLRLEPAIENVCGMLNHVAVKAGVQLSVFVDPRLPRAVVGDENRLRQVLVNLVGNAIKFSGGRSFPGVVAVRAEPVELSGNAVTIDVSVTDNGIGMDDATQARLFTPFSQADVSTTRRFGGTGLGLAISSMLVSLMGGSLTVRSAPARGSTFTVRVRLPVADGAAEGDEFGALVQGLNCRVVGTELPLADDLAAYLTQGGANVARSPDLATAFAASPQTGAWVWLVLAGVPIPDTEELRALAAESPDLELRFVALAHGNRRRWRADTDDFVTLDANLLFRRALFKALAQLTGRFEHIDPTDVPDTEPGALEAQRQRDERLMRQPILVAEDNETNRSVIRRQLKLLGFAAEVAVDGLDALERWRDGDFALLLTDLHMPMMDGYALTTAIRAEEQPGRRTPIIALTANALRDEELRCLDAGMDAYLTKPVRLQQLKTTIEQYLDAAASLPASLAAAPDASEPADLSVLVALVGDDPDLINEVLRGFRNSAAQSGREFREALEINALPQAANAAHKLKAAARSIGAMRLGALCADIEDATHAGLQEEAIRLSADFDRELQAVYGFLDAR